MSIFGGSIFGRRLYPVPRTKIFKDAEKAYQGLLVKIGTNNFRTNIRTMDFTAIDVCNMVKHITGVIHKTRMFDGRNVIAMSETIRNKTVT